VYENIQTAALGRNLNSTIKSLLQNLRARCVGDIV
jgi:hypothetical protein